MPGMLSSINAPTCPTHMFYLDFFLLCLLTFTISSKYLFPTFLTILSLYNSQIGITRVIDLCDLPSLVCLSFNFARNFNTSQVMGLWLTLYAASPHGPQVLTSYSYLMLPLLPTRYSLLWCDGDLLRLQSGQFRLCLGSYTDPSDTLLPYIASSQLDQHYLQDNSSYA
jgi:hypothetical protein